MTFVIAAPDLVTAAATDLENIGSNIGAASSAAAGSTTALLPAAQDEVSAAIASLFGLHGKMFQALSAQAAAFHQQFVQALNAAAGAYASTEAAGIPSLQAAPTLTGVATALQNGGAALAPGLLAPAAGTGLASIAGPYETLFANTAANLRTLEAAIAANPAPFLRQFLLNQIGYARGIAAGAQYVLQNLPAVLANLPANIRAAVQALLAFNPVPVIQQFIAQQITYAQILATSLQNAAHDFVVGLEQLPAAFQSAVQALMAGNVGGAVSDIAQGFLGLFVSGVDVTTTGDPLVPPGLAISVVPTGTLGDLLPILTIPGMMAQNFTNLLPPGSIPAQVSQNFTNVIDTLTNTSINANALLGLGTSGLSATLTTDIGLPAALLIDAVGAPVNAFDALSASAAQFAGDLQTGNLTGAIATLIDAPAVVTNGFLNGETSLPLSLDLPAFSTNLGNSVLLGTLSFTNGTANINIPLDGLLVPQTPITATITGTATGTGLAISASNIAAALVNSQIPLNVDVLGTPTSGLITALLVYAPEQLALAITPPG
ncbi:PE family protein [Mycobacterium paraense]|uniref:PE family protein n=1 Tax=Mycobacterium paraense TaxID=767916 RepID=UPI00111C423F|nr:PE family protein [Mycobacterium paraense]